MLAFIAYQAIMFSWMLGLYIYGISIRYGHEFGQMVYVTDSDGSTKSIFNDGTFVIENGEIIGNITLEEAKQNELADLNARLEPKYIYFLRVFFLVIGLAMVAAVMCILILIMFFLCLFMGAKMAGS